MRSTADVNEFGFVCIYKSTNNGVIISTLEIIQSNLFIVVIPAIVERVDGGDVTAGRVLFNRRHTPCIVSVLRYRYAVCVRNGNYIALQVLDEVVGNRVVENPANAVFVIIERNKRIFSPSLTENLGAVNGISMENAVTLFARSDAVCIVGLLLVSVNS